MMNTDMVFIERETKQNKDKTKKVRYCAWCVCVCVCTEQLTKRARCSSEGGSEQTQGARMTRAYSSNKHRHQSGLDTLTRKVRPPHRDINTHTHTQITSQYLQSIYNF